MPFACLGIALGYWAPPKAALPLANLLYLVLAVRRRALDPAVGLSGGGRGASRATCRRAPTPTRSSPPRSGSGSAWRAWLALAAFAALFGLLAVAGYRRDEGRRFST